MLSLIITLDKFKYHAIINHIVKIVLKDKVTV